MKSFSVKYVYAWTLQHFRWFLLSLFFLSKNISFFEWKLISHFFSKKKFHFMHKLCLLCVSWIRCLWNFFYNIHTGWIARTLTKCSLMCNWIFHSLTVWRVHAENLISHFFFSTEELRAQNTKIVKSNQTSGMLSASTAKPISVSHNLKIQHMTTVAT